MAQKKTKAQKRASELAKEARKITKTNVASQSQSKSKSKPRVGKVSNAQLGDVVKGKPKTPLHPKQDLNVKDPPKTRVPRPPVQQPNPLDPGEARASDAWTKEAEKEQGRQQRKADKDAAKKAAKKASETSTKVKPPNILSKVLKGAGILGTAYAFFDPTELNKGEPPKAVWSDEEKAKIYATTNVSQANLRPTKPASTKSTTAEDDWNQVKTTVSQQVSKLKKISASTASTNRNSTNIPVRAVDTTLNKSLTRTLLETTKPDIRDDWQNVTPTDTQKAYKDRITAEKTKNRKKLGENITAIPEPQPEAPPSKSGGGWLNQAIANALNVPVTPGTEIDDPSTKSGTRTEYPAHQLNSVTSWPKSWSEKRITDYIDKKENKNLKIPKYVNF